MRAAAQMLMLLFVMALTGFGWAYWHLVTHASVDATIRDVALKTERQLYGPVKEAEIVFFDDQGTELARGAMHGPIGVFAVRHPQAGDCRQFETGAVSDVSASKAWRQCFDTISRWLVSWVDDTHHASVITGKCRIKSVPVMLQAQRGDWWLWWVPHPHIGGTPYTYFSITMTVDSRRCTAAEVI